jgi:hypothetical protein
VILHLAETRNHGCGHLAGADLCGRCWLTSHSTTACVRKPGFALIVVLVGLLIVGAFLLFDRRLENIAQ